MAEYIYALTGAVLVSELFMMLMPQGTLRQFAKTAVGILLMLMMLFPLKNCTMNDLKKEEGKISYENAYKTSYSDIIMDIYTDAMESSEETEDG